MSPFATALGGRPEAFIPNTQRLRARPGSAAGRVRVRTVLCGEEPSVLDDAVERLAAARMARARVAALRTLVSHPERLRGGRGM